MFRLFRTHACLMPCCANSRPITAFEFESTPFSCSCPPTMHLGPKEETLCAQRPTKRRRGCWILRRLMQHIVR